MYMAKSNGHHSKRDSDEIVDITDDDDAANEDDDEDEQRYRNIYIFRIVNIL